MARRAEVFIANDNSLCQQSIHRVVAALTAQRLVPLLGAGICKASGLPLAKDLTLPLRSALWESILPLTRASLDFREDMRVAARVINEAPLERLLAFLRETHGQSRIEQYLAVLDSDTWNRNHAAIAALATKGFLPVCVTLNFDLLIEEAVTVHGGSCMTECPLSDKKPFSMGTGATVLRIIKPHGSLAPKDSGYRKYELVAATLHEIGDRIDPRNLEHLEAVLTEGKELFVAGYSDHDWDIFPIIRRLTPKLAHIHWVQYADLKKVENRAWLHTLDINERTRVQRVMKWLATLSTPSTFYVGDPSDLLSAIAVRLRADPRKPSPPKQPAHEKPNGKLFVQSLPVERTQIKTAVTMATLLQDRGRFDDLLSEWLLAQPMVERDPCFQARLHRVLAHNNHTRRKILPALRHMQEVIRLKSNNGREFDGHVSDDLVWMGYEYLCLAKRLVLRAPWLILLAPWHVHKGFRLIVKGVRLDRCCDRKGCRRLLAAARYYRVELLHAWAEHLLYFGLRFEEVIQEAFRVIADKYDVLSKDYPDFMEWEYYWLRHLEARLLGNLFKTIDLPDVEQRMDEIAANYKMLQNHVQEGNIYVYRALLLFRLDPKGSHKRINHLLLRAERTWSRSDGVAMAGLYRILLYRRFFGLPGFWNMVWRLVKIARRPSDIR